MYVSNETLLSLYFSLQVPKILYKMKGRPLMTSSKIDIFLLLLYDFGGMEGLLLISYLIVVKGKNESEWAEGLLPAG